MHPEESVLSHAVATTVLLLLTGSFYYIPLAVLVCVYQAIVNGSLVCTALLVLLVASLFYPSKILWQGFIDARVWDCLRRYFRFRIIKEEEFRFDEHYIFAEFPHGIIPLGFMLSATIVQSELAGVVVEGAIASVLFRIPILQHLCRWFGSRPATKRNIHHLLDRGSVGLMVGGVAEIYLAERARERVYLKKRRGFIRIALERGATLVPIYYFGNTQLLDKVGASENSWLSRVSRSLQMSLLLFYGRYYLPLPYPTPITMVVGKAIPVEQVVNPTEQQVDALHKQFTAALVALFDKHKVNIKGYERKTLEVV